MTIHLKEEEKIQVLNSKDIYQIMQMILGREEKIDQDREHFWIIGLANDNRIKLIELISLGTSKSVLVEPMEVFSLALQKRAVKLILCHNHPSGNLKASEDDIDVTDRLYQVGKIVDCPILDHVIIDMKNHNSFKDSGLLEEISMSTKYVAPYLLEKRFKEELEKKDIKSKRDLEKNDLKNKKQIARKMKKGNYSLKEISELTGLKIEDVEML